VSKYRRIDHGIIYNKDLDCGFYKEGRDSLLFVFEKFGEKFVIDVCHYRDAYYWRYEYDKNTDRMRFTSRNIPNKTQLKKYLKEIELIYLMKNTRLGSLL
jgi:hypothetical protein